MKKKLEKGESQNQQLNGVKFPSLSLNIATGIIKEEDSNEEENKIKIRALFDFVGEELKKLGYDKLIILASIENSKSQRNENFLCCEDVSPNEVVGALTQAAVRRIMQGYEQI